MKVKLKKIVEMFNAMSKMREAGISLKGLKNIDMAMNKATIEPIVNGYNIATDTPKDYKKYVEAIEDLKMKSSTKNGTLLDPQQTRDEFIELKNRFSKAIEEYEEFVEMMKVLPEEEKEVKLITFSKEDFKFSEDNALAMDVIYGLLPCIDVGE